MSASRDAGVFAYVPSADFVSRPSATQASRRRRSPRYGVELPCLDPCEDVVVDGREKNGAAVVGTRQIDDILYRFHLKTSFIKSPHAPQCVQSFACGHSRTRVQSSPAASNDLLSKLFGKTCGASISSARLPSYDRVA